MYDMAMLHSFWLIKNRWFRQSPEIIASINIAGGIVDYAEENDINLIVIGTRGLSGFKKLLLGSVATHVITYAHCPVMVVK